MHCELIFSPIVLLQCKMWENLVLHFVKAMETS